jgi:hypothetical protein
LTSGSPLSCHPCTNWARGPNPRAGPPGRKDAFAGKLAPSIRCEERDERSAAGSLRDDLGFVVPFGTFCPLFTLAPDRPAANRFDRSCME